jgi:hypothetical protein
MVPNVSRSELPNSPFRWANCFEGQFGGMIEERLRDTLWGPSVN